MEPNEIRTAAERDYDAEEAKRDEEYFRDGVAIAWVQGWMACPNAADISHAEAAGYAYRMADALVLERRKRLVKEGGR